MIEDQFVIGVDYGSDSVRSVLINALNGEEIANFSILLPALAAEPLL